ncbi:hypothetical protein [Tenuibacillus multivorans]|uniref:hypothetical protein n=1 Tax=Tenuibacillus multivorans TaxID=237069 RepID=UPI000B88C503|nr:hypothetical protein [Tenuibacillus multivorans]
MASIELVSRTPPLTFAFVRVVVFMQVSQKIKPEGFPATNDNTDKSILSIRTVGTTPSEYLESGAMVNGKQQSCGWL